LKSRIRPFSWDHIIVLVVSLIGLSFNLNESPKQNRALASLSQIIDLGCLDSQPIENTYFQKQTIIRLRGRLCSPPRSRRFDSSLKIFNSSNGKSSVVFIQEQNKQFLTAELPLVPGSNHIQIEWQDSFNAMKKVRTAQVFSEPI